MESLELRIFREVACTKSLSRAAEHLGYVQSNITAHMKKLERELNTTLLIRHNKGVMLTENGEKLLQYADEIVSLLDHALNVCGEASKQLKIGSAQTIAGYLLPQCIIEYQKKFPNLTFSVSTSTPQEMNKRLEQRQLDCVITNDPHIFTNAQCIFKARESLSVITPEICKSAAEIWQFPLVVNNMQSCPYRKILSNWFLFHDISYKIIELDTVESIINTVAAGAGVSLLPENILHDQSAVNTFDIPELESSSISVWIHKNAFPSDFSTLKEIVERMVK